MGVLIQCAKRRTYFLGFGNPNSVFGTSKDISALFILFSKVATTSLISAPV